ncbi:MAG: acetyl-CoA carboxylase biotin carboxyl carrier protein [Elusimicrobia bacterium]|nr:acetyl-CoA carboxylase biotin carboxyl carrier protein [Elusimicrobiota bacterium]MBP9699542.1 acetyl-CoA carboxylase biotin carboxyl carrier protein [Elusimicrobiota bacterium]
MSEQEPIDPNASKDAGGELERYYEIMRAHDLTELEIKEGDRYVKLSRSTHATAAAPAPLTVAVPVAAPPAKSPHHPVTSPLAGMFYRSPAPNAPSFVKEGDKVAFGDVLCIVEAMKVMNEIRSDRPGVIHKILAENGKPVSAGQELFLIDSLSA